MKTIAAAIVATLFAVAPATAAPKTAPAAEPTPVAAGGATVAPVQTRNANTRYCYKTEMTGSHILSRVCKTRDAWKAQGVIVPANL